MITKEQIRFFKKISSGKNDYLDLESYDRWGTVLEKKELLSVRQMERIMLLRYGIQLIETESNYASSEYQIAFNHLLETECKDKETLQELKTIDKKGLWKKFFRKR